MHTFRVQGLDQELRVARFDGHEGVSQLFAFEVTVACEDKDIAFASVLGQPAVLTIHAGDATRYVHGIVGDFEQGDEGTKRTAYRVALVPAVWRLRHRRAVRIFQGDTVPQIIEKVLTKAGLPASARRASLRSSYRPREYCVQYRETDWAFLSRLMEEEGIFYFFEHSERGHVLVIADNPSAHPPLAGGDKLPFRPATGALMTGDNVARFRFGERVLSGKVTLRDYNFKKPTLSLEGASQAADVLEVYDYPGDYDDPGVGEKVAELRLQQLQAARQTGEGESSCARLAAGCAFSMLEHPRDDFNRGYVITRVEHRGSEPGLHATPSGESHYDNRFEVIPAAVPFRPPQITPKPTVRGVQTAFVVGPQGEEIYTDEHGRVKVKFHWDREGKGDETSSCWIRVSQAWAGAAWGAMYLPRVGHEVVVDFIEGDPDRPLIVGSVYHAANVPPYPLPGEKTKSTIKSSSSPGGGGSNELRFEDRKGSEEVYVHAQKDLNVAVEHDEARQVGNNRSKTVAVDDSEAVGGNKTIMVAQNQMETIGANDNLTVGGNLLVAVGGAIAISGGGGAGGDVSGIFDGNVQIEIRKTMSLTVDQDRTDAVGGGSTWAVTGDATTSVGGDASTSVNGSHALTVGKDSTLSVGGNQQEQTQKQRMIVVGEQLSITCGDSTITVDKQGKITITGKDITVSSDGPVKIDGQKIDVKSQSTVNVQASGDVKVKGGHVTMN